MDNRLVCPLSKHYSKVNQIEIDLVDISNKSIRM